MFHGGLGVLRLEERLFQFLVSLVKVKVLCLDLPGYFKSLPAHRGVTGSGFFEVTRKLRVIGNYHFEDVAFEVHAFVSGEVEEGLFCFFV